jgi:hypothetical protein
LALDVRDLIPDPETILAQVGCVVLCTPQAHGVLMAVVFVVILPVSVVIAHSMRDTWGPRLWFQIHRGMGVRPPAVFLQRLHDQAAGDIGPRSYSDIRVSGVVARRSQKLAGRKGSL